MNNTYSILINATPADVFYWLDDAKRTMQWIPNIVENEDLEVTKDRIGSTFRQVYDENGRRMEMTGVVTEYETNKRLACKIHGSAFDLAVGYELDDLDGKTRITQCSQVRFNGVFWRIMGKVMMPFIKKSSLRQLEESFDKLKQLAESGRQP